MFSEPRGDAATKHLVANNKPLTFTVLSKIRRPLDPHFGGRGGSLSAFSTMGAMGPCWGTQSYSLEGYGEPQGHESVGVNFSERFLSAFPTLKGSVRHKQHCPPSQNAQAAPPPPSRGRLRGAWTGAWRGVDPVSWALPEFCWALQFFKLALNNSALM